MFKSRGPHCLLAQDRIVDEIRELSDANESLGLVVPQDLLDVGVDVRLVQEHPGEARSPQELQPLNQPDGHVLVVVGERRTAHRRVPHGGAVRPRHGMYWLAGRAVMRPTFQQHTA